MKLTILSAAVAATTLVLAQSAQAREHHRHHFMHQTAWRHYGYHTARSRHYEFGRVARRHYYYVRRREFEQAFWPAEVRRHHPRLSWRHVRADRLYAFAEQEPYENGRAGRRHSWASWRESAYGGGYGARPAAWCGWEMRHLVGADPGPSYNLARNWAHWGHAGPPGVGAIVVWSHHVGKIVGRQGGQWIIESGNDGRRVRTRPRSIAGAIAIRWS